MSDDATPPKPHDPERARLRLARKRIEAELHALRGELDLLLEDLPEEERASRLRAIREAYRERVHELASRGPLPWDELCERFELQPLDRVLLTVAIANELAPDFARRFAALHGHGERTWPTAALVMETLVERASWPALRARLSADAPLIHYRLLMLGGDADYLGALHRPLIASARVLSHVTGELRVDPTLRAHTRHYPLEHQFHNPWQLEPALARTLVRARGAASLSDPLFVILGAEGSGRTRLLHTLAGELGRGVISFDLPALARDHDHDLEAGLRLALREARLMHAVPCLRGFDQLMAEPRRQTEDDAPQVGEHHQFEDITRTLSRALEGFPGPAALLFEDPLAQRPGSQAVGREVVELSVGMPTATSATTLWAGALRHAPLEGELTTRLGTTFILTPGQIEDAAGAILRERRIAEAGGQNEAPVDFRVVHEEVKRQLRNRLGDVATLVTKRYAWDELVADTTVKVQLRELISRHRHHHKVMETWRFGERFGKATGISALFEGPPGTGKTMAASIIAGELGLDLFQVDLAQVVSKYIGETEKQLARLFDEAERAGAVLLFDEADSLFSKRTQVSSSNDRYSNLKVNFLLQRIERFTGVAVLTTNFPESMDEAFGRRVTVRVRFPQPDASAREALWRSMLERCEVVSDDVWFEGLAKDFELSGGLIRNAVLRAAYMAASRDRAIDHDLLELSARLELKQQGKLLTGDPLGDLAKWAANR